jgi:hypothetical protein
MAVGVAITREELDALGLRRAAGGRATRLRRVECWR